MTYFSDVGAIFDVPKESVWRLLTTPSEHDHGSVTNMLVEQQSSTCWIRTYDFVAPSGLSLKLKYKITYYPPVGLVFEFLSGCPFEGSKMFQYYVPTPDSRTEVNVVGELVSPTLDDEELRRAYDTWAQVGFDEDNEAMKKTLLSTPAK